MRFAVRLLALAAFAPAAACDTAAIPVVATESRESPQIFLAQDDSFANFQNWTKFTISDPPAIESGTHALGTRLVYINHLPPPGSSEFPVGTIICKIIPALLSTHGPTTFAMAKRGGDYNSGGAAGWEWYQLNIADPLAGPVLWKGTDSPTGTYGGLTNTGCNECHALAQGNDFVQSPVLDLSKL